MSARTLAGLLAVMVIGCMLGCASSPVTLRETYKPAAPVKHSKAGTRRIARLDTVPCVVHLAVVTDHRTDPSLLGNVAGRSILSPGQGPQWITGLLTAGLAHNGVEVSTAVPDAASKHVLITEARLLKAWVASLSTSMNGSIVIGVRQADSGEEKIYRGASTSLNWASGEGEVQALFDEAVEQLMTTLSTDLRSQCASM
jgi:hypothetical protein